MPNPQPLFRDVRLLYLVYVPALLAGILLLPLWLPEILQLAGAVDPQTVKLSEAIDLSPQATRLVQMLNWSAASPGESPLGYLIQFPFVVIFGFAPWAARLPSVLLATLNVLLFWRLAQRANLRNIVIAVVLFAAIPIHYQFAVEARPFELGLTGVLLTAICFLRVMEEPSIRNSIYYGVSLLLCLYATPRSVISGVGFALCTLAFINSKEVRTSLWHLLPAAAGAGLLYLPWVAWAQHQHLAFRLIPPDTYFLTDTNWPKVFRDFSGGGNAGYLLTLMLTAGVGVGLWRAYKYSAASQVKRQALFCLFGGALISVAINLSADNASNSPFAPSQMLWSLPGFLILFCAGLDWLESIGRFALWPVAALFLIFCVVGNYTFLTSRDEDIKSIAAAGLPELTQNSCAVFVSERLSPFLFRTIEPKLSPLECLDFFHSRIVMLIHPYVEAAQQKDAELYFRGLNFHEVKRVHTGGGEVVVFESGS